MNPGRLFGGTLLLINTTLSADIVTDWNSLALEAIRNESTAPPLAARDLAILHTSIFDAVNSITRSYQDYVFNVPATSGASLEAAALGAAHQSLINLFPSQRATFDSAYSISLSSIPAGTSRESGLSVGLAVADRMVSMRSSDGSSTTIPYIPSTDPGQWQRTPPFFRPPDLPQWGQVTPFAMQSGAQFRPAGPPSLTSAQYAADLNQVKSLGGVNSTVRTPEQTQVARFWSDFSYTVTPPGHWNQIAQNVAHTAGTSLEHNARMFAVLNVGMADAGIAAWDAKYVYNFWRPVTAVQNADIDGNADTVADPNWLPLLNTPSFPEYMSGHSTFSGAAASLLAKLVGTDHFQFSVGSDTLPGVVRSYDSFEAAAEEIGMSRIYGGIHFLSADLDGLATGKSIGDYVWDNYFQPVPEPSAFAIAGVACLGFGLTAITRKKQLFRRVTGARAE